MVLGNKVDILVGDKDGIEVGLLFGEEERILLESKLDKNEGV